MIKFSNKSNRGRVCLLGTLRFNDAKATRTSKKTIGFTSKTATLHVHHVFLYISLPFLPDYYVKMPTCFMEDVNKQRRNLISLSELEYGPLEFKFRRIRIHLAK